MKIVRDEHSRFAEFSNEACKFLLKIGSRDHVQSSKRLIQQDYRGVGG